MGLAIHIPWYATGFRGDDLEAALQQISQFSLRYGAKGYSVYRSWDDRYKFLQVIEFDDKSDFQRFWYGQEFIDMRAACQGWYQVPLLYTWNDIVAEDRFEAAAEPEGSAAPG